jgi:Holliday junction DNA helicase RuvB
MPESFVESALCQQDVTFEVPLRPQTLGDFRGQEVVRQRLEVVIAAAKQRGEPLGHCLFCGPPGLGKTTLANILSKAMGTNLVVTSGPVIEKAADLAGVLTNLQEGDILFIDEIHRLNRTVEEYLYPAMEDFALDLMIDSGPSARSVQVTLNKFTLAGATTRVGLLSSPMRSRFALNYRLEFYEPATLVEILQRTARILNLKLKDEAALEIALRSRGTPRVANNLLRWVRDYAQIHANGVVTKEVAEVALELLAIDRKGLDELDIKILRTIIEHYNGGPVGLSTIAVAVGEEPSTIEGVYEPHLITQGFLKRTPRGRETTELARQHLEMNTGEKI